jgi:SAM-dependent methyltransferase
LTPIARNFGFDRGLPVDRYFIEGFLHHNRAFIRGAVLEIGDDTYTRRFGGSQVTSSDVLHVGTGNPQATIVADLSEAEHLRSDAFDCVICTQTLQFIYDVRSAVQTLHRILKPGGTILATVPGISQTDDVTWASSWFWSFTPLAASRLFEEAFGSPQVETKTYGNVLSSTAFLHGIASHELTCEELSYNDLAYPLLTAIKATKKLGGSA